MKELASCLWEYGCDFLYVILHKLHFVFRRWGRAGPDYSGDQMFAGNDVVFNLFAH